MAIDMGALQRAAIGAPNARVEVNKRWLGEVHRMLLAGERAERELASIKRNDTIIDSIFGARGRRRS
jgi:hypothetical protein